MSDKAKNNSWSIVRNSTRDATLDSVEDSNTRHAVENNTFLIAWNPTWNSTSQSTFDALSEELAHVK